jgi:hypothetical protein
MEAWGVLFCAGDGQRKRRADAGLALDGQGAAVLGRQFAANGQPEAEAALVEPARILLGAEERFEYALEVFRRDSDPGIADADGDHAVVRGSGVHGEPASLPEHRLAGIQDEIEQYLLDLMRVDADFERRVDLDVDGDVVLGEVSPEAADGVVDERGDPASGRARFSVLDHSHEPVGHLTHDLSVFERFLEGGFHEARVVGIEGGASIGHDRRKEVVEFVREHGGHGADTGEALRAAELIAKVDELILELVELCLQRAFVGRYTAGRHSRLPDGGFRAGL